MTRIFITGANGMLGFELLLWLSANRAGAVTGIARRLPDLPATGLDIRLTATPLDGSWFSGDDAKATILHCSGLANPRIPFASYQDLSRQEIEPNLGLVEALVAKGWRGHLIFLSSGGTVYGDPKRLPIKEYDPTHPQSPYGLQKVVLEQGFAYLAHRHGFRLTILRVANPYGALVAKEGQGVIPILIDAVRTGKPFTLIGSGDEVRDYIHVSDFCRAVEAVITQELFDHVNLFNIGSGQGVSLRALIEFVSDKLGKSPTIVSQPSYVDVKSNVLNIERVEQHLGWHPRILIFDGVATLINPGSVA